MLYFDTLAEALEAQKINPHLPILHERYCHMGEWKEVFKIDTYAKALEKAHYANVQALYSGRELEDDVSKMGRLD